MIENTGQTRSFRITLSGVLTSLLWVGGIGLVGANFVLLRQNGELRTVATAATKGSNEDIQPGKHVSRHLAAATLADEFRLISFPAPDAQRTLMITFSPVCPHCKANKKNWDVIANELRHRDGWRILLVSGDPIDMTKDYCEDSGIPLEEAFADPTYRTWMSLNLSEVPTPSLWTAAA